MGQKSLGNHVMEKGEDIEIQIKKISVRVPHHEWEAIYKFCKRNRISMTALVRQSVHRTIKKGENNYEQFI